MTSGGNPVNSFLAEAANVTRYGVTSICRVRGVRLPLRPAWSVAHGFAPPIRLHPRCPRPAFPAPWQLLHRRCDTHRTGWPSRSFAAGRFSVVWPSRDLLGDVECLYPDSTTGVRFWARCRFWGLPCQDLLRRRAAHADAVRNADALIGVARHVQAGDLRQTRFQFGLARGMSDRVLRHGARPAGNAREAGASRDAGDLAQFAAHGRDHRFVALAQHACVLHAAEEAARHDLAFGNAIRKLGAYPGARYQPPPLFLGHQEPEA